MIDNQKGILMKNHLAVIGIFILLLVFNFIGCVDTQSTEEKKFIGIWAEEEDADITSYNLSYFYENGTGFYESYNYEFQRYYNFKVENNFLIFYNFYFPNAIEDFNLSELRYNYEFITENQIRIAPEDVDVIPGDDWGIIIYKIN